MAEPKFQTVQRESIYRDDVLALRRDSVRSPQGDVFKRRVIERTEAVAVAPVMDNDCVLLIRHYRHPVGRWLWELPGGAVDSGERPMDAAARELIEETGWRAEKLERLAFFYTDPAFSDHQVTIFAGRHLFRVGSGAISEQEIVTASSFSRQEIKELIADGEVASSWTMLGLTTLLSSER